MKSRNIAIRIWALFFAFIIAIFVGLPSYSADASSFDDSAGFGEEDENSVLADLTKDKNFNVNDYPAISTDLSMQVIQIAESDKKELFIYVYQPAASTYDFTATHISISQTVYGNEVWYRYNLTLLSTQGVFEKYKVEDFTMETGVVRYYNISAIYRAYDSAIDGDTDSSSPTDGIAYEVAQQWKACTLDNEVSYSMVTTEVLTLTNQWSGHINYSNGYFGSTLLSNCDAWFVALTADMEIENLMEADVTYSWTTYQYKVNYLTGAETTTTVDSKSNEFISLDGEMKGGTEGDGLFGYQWEWNRIVSISSFLSENGDNLSDECKKYLSFDNFSGGWVLRFAETRNESYTVEGSVGGTVMQTAYYHDYTDVSQVAVLRLKFKSHGKVYNLGVVADSLNPDSYPDGGYDIGDGIEQGIEDVIDDVKSAWKKFLSAGKRMAKILFWGFLIVVIFAILIPFIPYIFKGIVWVVSLPFKLLLSLLKKGDKKNKKK